MAGKTGIDPWREFVRGSSRVTQTKALPAVNVKAWHFRRGVVELMRMSGRDWADLMELFLLRVVAIALLCFLLAFAEMAAPVKYLRCQIVENDPGVMNCVAESEW